MSIANTGFKLYNRLINLLNYLRSPLLLVVRLYWGFQMMQTGWGKLHNLAKVTAFFTSLGIPLPAVNAPAVPQPPAATSP